jgi:hypothetical protein
MIPSRPAPKQATAGPAITPESRSAIPGRTQASSRFSTRRRIVDSQRSTPAQARMARGKKARRDWPRGRDLCLIRHPRFLGSPSRHPPDQIIHITDSPSYQGDIPIRVEKGELLELLSLPSDYILLCLAILWSRSSADEPNSRRLQDRLPLPLTQLPPDRNRRSPGIQGRNSWARP